MNAAGDLRIGDAERDATIELLGRHFVDGRLTRLEHEERAGAALGARTQSDLDVLLADLPDLEARDRRERAPAHPVPYHRGGLPWPLPLVLLVFLMVGVAAHGGPVLPLLVLAMVLARLAGRGPWRHARGPGRGPHRH